MKFTGRSRTYANTIIKHIESLGGKLQKECPGGSIYCSLEGLRQVRISDHIALKGDIDRVDVIIQKEKEKYKFICIYYRNMVIYDNLGKVKQWIENLEFAIKIVIMNMATNSIVNKRNYETQIDTLKKEITLKENKAIEWKAKISELQKDLANAKQIITKQNKTVREAKKSVENNAKYHNMYYQEASKNSKLEKKIERYEKLLNIKENGQGQEEGQ